MATALALLLVASGDNCYTNGQADMVDLRRTRFEADGLVCDILYLLARNDETSESDPYARAPIAPGMARFWSEFEKKAIGAGRPADAARARVNEWNGIAEITWPRVCSTFGDKLVEELHMVDAFCVVPSSRESIRAPLVSVMRERFANAHELLYTKPAAFFFGGATQEQIVSALDRRDAVTLPNRATVVVADDWCGNGTTFRALVERISKDHPKCDLTFVGAFPGISSPKFARSSA